MICNFYIWRNLFFHRLYILQQEQKGIPSTIPKHPIGDQETGIVKKPKKNTNTKIPAIIPFFVYCHLQRLQRNPYLPSTTVGLLATPSASAKLRTIHKTFLLKIPSVRHSKIATHKLIQISLCNWGNIHFKLDICNSPYRTDLTLHL